MLKIDKKGVNIVKKIVSLLFLLVFFGATAELNQVSAENEDFIVKVKLNESLGPQSTYYFETKGESILAEDKTVVLTKNKKYKVQVENKSLTIKDGEKVIAQNLPTITIKPKIYKKENHVYIYRGDKPTTVYPYMGTVIFRISGSTQIQPVNELMFEDYLKGVLPGETPASWGSSGGMEALKAQAIAARSYVFAKAGGKFTVEIDDTTKYQVFKGFIWDPISPKYLSSYQNTNRAVDETAGKVMTYKKTNGTDGFVSSYFSSSNGGRTELPQQYWSGSIPYIVNSKVDTFDTNNTDWEITWLKKQLNPSVDVTQPSSWWNTVGEDGLVSKNMPNPNDAKAFSSFKTRVLSDLKKADPTIKSIKIASIDEMTKKDYENTGKVSEITLNFSYYTQHENGTNLSYDMIPGAKSQTLSGASRYDTAVEIAKEYVGTAKAETIVLGRGDVPADALAGTVLAHKFKAPIMLIRNNSLPASVEAFIKEKVQPKAKVYLLGGTSAISSELEADLKLRGFDVVRVSGKNRTATSLAIAAELQSATDEVMIASGDGNSSDALSASAYAAVKQIPIIIHSGEKLATQTKEYLNTAGIRSVKLIGGHSVIPLAVESELKEAYSTNRIGGASRVDTSIAINQQLPLDGQNIVIGNAYSFVDSLAGSVLAAKTGSPILLLHPDAVQIPGTFLNSLPIKNQAYFLGGSQVISEKLKTAINEYVVSELNKKKSKLTFKGSNKNVYENTMGHFRDMLGASVLKSVDFDLVNESDRILMDGTGYGHGIGMSQYGAFGRSKAGQTAEQILTFYYDNIEIKSRSMIIQ